MKLLLPIIALSILLLSSSAHALRLTDGLYFTVAPNSSAEVIFLLPEDMGAGLGKADYYVTTTSNWSTDLSESIITTDENNTVLTPIRFYSDGKNVGDCSNFTVKITAPSLSLSKSWRGGVCLSKYADVDINTMVGDPKKVMSNNVDLFGVGFSSYAKTVKPGEAVSLELLLQSQASLTIDVTVQSPAPFEQKSFVVQTNASTRTWTLYLNASSLSVGTYDVKATAKARNCSLDSCTKQTAMRLTVSEVQPKGGFSVSIFPQTLNVKNLEPVSYSFTIQNDYPDSKDFVANVQTPPDLDSSFMLGTVTVPGLSQKTVGFNVTPRTQIATYEIKLNVSSDFVERSVSAYLKTNEMAADVYRNAEEATTPAVKASTDAISKTWYNSYSKSDGTDIQSFNSTQAAIDAAKKQPQTKPSQTQNTTDDGSTQEEQPAPQNPLGLILVPVVLGAVILVVLLLYRRSQKNEDGEVLESI